MGKAQRQQPLAPLLHHMAVTVEATTSVSLCLSLSRYPCTQLHAHYTTNNVKTFYCFFPKSYLYTYDFQAIYTYGPKGLNRTHSRMCPFQPAEEVTTGTLIIRFFSRLIRRDMFPNKLPLHSGMGCRASPIRCQHASSLSGVSTLVNMSDPFSAV